MRRMNSRSPPFAIIGLLLVCLVLAYNYWTLSSQNDDLRKEIDKLQTEVKISGVKQDQFEKKNEVMQNNVHDLDEKSERLQRQVEDEVQQLKEAQNDIKKKQYEITSLKNDLLKKQELEKDLKQQIEEKDAKIEELSSESQHILGLKNDADEALSEKDSLINDLKRQLEQLKMELSAVNKENIAGAPPSIPGPMNIPIIEKKEPYDLNGSLKYVPRKAVHTRDKGLKGMKFHQGAVILPSQPSNIPKAKPRFSVASIVAEHRESANQIQQPASETKVEQQMKEEGHEVPSLNNVIPNPPIALEDNNVAPVDQVVEKPKHQRSSMNKQLSPPHRGLGRRPVPLDLHEDLQEPVEVSLNDVNLLNDHHLNPDEANVLPQPPQNPDDNLDTAVDEEEKVIEDPLDDQDEEGKEIKKDLENNADDNYNNDDDYDDDKQENPIEPRGIGVQNHDKNGIVAKNPEQRKIGAHEIKKYDKNNKGMEGKVLSNRQLYDENNNNEVNLDEDMENKAKESFFENSFDNKLKNLGRHL